MTKTLSDFRTWLAQVNLEIEIALQLSVAAEALPKVPSRLREAMAHALLSGGKRIRPALCLLATEASGGTRARGLPAAVACEMIHAYSLIHDDLPCMDDDVLRRGQATTHVAFGQATAVLAGDALQALAFQTLASQAESNLVCSQVSLLAFAVGPAGMVGGQQMDMDSEGKDLDADAVLAIHSAKTGALLEAAVHLGVRAAEADLQPWKAYAAAIGRLFQISDDLLDATRSTAELGKTAGKDLAAEKATVVGAMGLAQARCFMEREAHRALAALESIHLQRHQEILADLPLFLSLRGA